MIRKTALPLALGAIATAAVIAVGSASARADQFTFAQAKSLPTSTLAMKLLGDSLGSTVIEAIRHDHDGQPQDVELYTQPVLTDPRLNGICRTDVITVEYNWTESPEGSAPVKISHIQATPRYKSFRLPPGEPGTSKNEEAQAAACAGMRTAVDAFRAPSAGDAQWLAKIEAEYMRGAPKFAFTCTDFVDRSCQKARQALSALKLGPTVPVEKLDCRVKKKGDQLDQCYRLTFPYPGKDAYPDNQDEREFADYDAEWTVTILAGIKDGMAPVHIISLDMKHERKPLIMY